MTPATRCRRSYHAVRYLSAAAVLTLVGIVALIDAKGTREPPQPRESPAGTLAFVSHRAGGSATDPEAARHGLHGGTHESRPSPSRPTTNGPVMSRSRPVRIDISAIGVSSDLLRLVLNPDGTLEAPGEPLQAGWYVHSPTPGQVGPAVIAGHVDSWETGPAVFYRLGQLIPGQRVVVTRADSSRATFTIDGVREYPKAHFPTSTVYGDTSRAELRLITCGDWNEAKQQYDANVVVFAHLVRPDP